MKAAPGENGAAMNAREAAVGPVLVIDDNPDNRLFLSALLRENGYDVLTAGNADEGLERMRESRPALVCLDIRMPGKSGLVLYETMRRDDALRDTPVFFVSAFGRPEDFSPARFAKVVAGADLPPPQAFFEKPIDPEAFVRAVEMRIGPGAAVEAPAGNEADLKRKLAEKPAGADARMLKEVLESLGG